MKYLIWAKDNNRFRTKTNWISNESELFAGEKMLSFDTRREADELINKYRFMCCASYGIDKTHELFKHCA